MDQEKINKIVTSVLSRINNFAFEAESERPIPIGISNRHIHLSKTDLEVLFGTGYELKHLKELSQPGQYACVETVILAGPKGCIEQVRVLGPIRKQTQVEISRGDSIRLGVKAPLCESGKLKGSCGIIIIGPRGTIQLTEGVIIAQRHIHMTPQDATVYGVTDGQRVAVSIGEERGLTFSSVVVRVSDGFILECHIDRDEANAGGIENGDFAFLLESTSEMQRIKSSGSAKGQKIKLLDELHDIKGKQTGMTVAQRPLVLVTDEIVREAWKNNSKLIVRKNTLYTPLAKDTIKELKVEIIIFDTH